MAEGLFRGGMLAEPCTGRRTVAPFALMQMHRALMQMRHARVSESGLQGSGEHCAHQQCIAAVQASC